jgi:hypothetical protein
VAGKWKGVQKAGEKLEKKLKPCGQAYEGTINQIS